MADSRQTQRFSGRLFVRLYVLLLLSIMVIGSGLVYLVRQMDEANEVAYIKSLHRPLMDIIQWSLNAEPQQRWPDLLNELSQAAERSVALLSIQDFAVDQSTMSALANGELLVVFDNQDVITLYQMISQTSHVLAVEVPMSTVIVDEHAWVAPLFYLLIALVVYLLIRPFARQLLNLKDAAIQFGRGDFSARLELPRSNTLTPIADAFNGMAQKIERLLLTQRDLVNAVSHELRTPLARLKFAFEELAAESNGRMGQQSLAAMKMDVNELEALIDEMLRYAEVNQMAAFNQVPVPLEVLVDKLIADVGEVNKTVSLCYVPPVGPEDVLACHEHSILRALSNVMRNALSFAERHCELRLHRQADRLLIDISDDGPGLAGVNTERLFEPFFKVNSNQRKAGYGLGLAIAQSIAKKHQGRLSVVDGPLQGACFRFDLPFG